MQINQLKRVVITHSDLDGIGCAFLVARCMPVDDIKFINKNGDLPKILEEILKLPPMEVWVTDLSPSEKSLKLLDRIAEIHDLNLIDHHHSSMWLGREWALVDKSCSATMLVYKVLSTRFNIEDFLPLVKTIDDYDMWGYEKGAPSEMASYLNSLQSLLGPQLTLERFHQRPFAKLNDAEARFIAADLYKMEQYIHNTADPVVTEVDGIKFMTVCAERHHSQMGNLLLHDNPDIEFVALINYNLGHIGLRGRGNINLSILAQSYCGGGHAKSAGFPYRDLSVSSPDDIREVIKEWVHQHSTQSENKI